MVSIMGHRAIPPVSCGEKVPQCGYKKKDRYDGRDETVTAQFSDEAQLKVYKIHRRGRTHRGVKDRAETQAERERIESEARCQCEHVQIIDKAKIGHRHAEHTRIWAIEDDVASFDDRARKGPAGIVSMSNVDSVHYADERESEHGVWRDCDFK
jgi:hypothetical protein